ncbi:MAG: hypothetical protein ACXWP6_08345 [Ktedonobacterales bacterium]
MSLVHLAAPANNTACSIGARRTRTVSGKNSGNNSGKKIGNAFGKNGKATCLIIRASPIVRPARQSYRSAAKNGNKLNHTHPPRSGHEITGNNSGKKIGKNGKNGNATTCIPNEPITGSAWIHASHRRTSTTKIARQTCDQFSYIEDRGMSHRTTITHWQEFRQCLRQKTAMPAMSPTRHYP